MDLTKYRDQINEIDDQILALLQKRAEVSKRVGAVTVEPGQRRREDDEQDQRQRVGAGHLAERGRRDLEPRQRREHQAGNAQMEREPGHHLGVERPVQPAPDEADAGADEQRRDDGKDFCQQ